MNINQYQKLSHSEKIDFLQPLATQLGSDWKIDNDYLCYQPTKELFAFIPGGQMTMGFSIESLFALCKARGEKYKDGSWSWVPNIQAARPATDIVVYPFLIALEPENDMDMPAPFHLPSEAEMEWLLRNAGQVYFPGLKTDEKVTKSNRNKLVRNLQEHFGLHQLVDDIDNIGQQCEDSLHETYHQRPIDSLPWGHDQGVKRIVHTTWQDDADEIIAWHAANRQFETHGRRRKTLRLQHLLKSKPEASIPRDYGFFIDALESGKGADYEEAWATLQLLSYAPNKDMHGILIYLLKNQLTSEAQKPLLILQWLFRLAYGDTPKQLFNNTDPYAEDRIAIRTILSQELESILPFLAHKKPDVRAQTAFVLAAATDKKNEAQEILEAQLHIEKNIDVRNSILLSMALLLRRPLDGHLLNLPNISESTQCLAETISGKPDKQKIVSVIKRQNSLPYLDWFIYFLSDGDRTSTDNIQAALELANHAINTEDSQRRCTYLKVSLSLLFDKGEGLLLPNEITPPQKQLIEILTPDSPFRPYFISGDLCRQYQIPHTEAARAILLEKSTISIFSKSVDYNGQEMPLLCALNKTYCDNKLEGVKEYLRAFSLIDIIKMHHQVRDYIFHEYWPYWYKNRKILLDHIRNSDFQSRQDLCLWLKPVLTDYINTRYVYTGLRKVEKEQLEEDEKFKTAYLEYYFAAAPKEDAFKKLLSESLLKKWLSKEITSDIGPWRLLTEEPYDCKHNFNLACQFLKVAKTIEKGRDRERYNDIAKYMMFKDSTFEKNGLIVSRLLLPEEYTKFQIQIIPLMLDGFQMDYQAKHGITKTSMQIVANLYQGLLAKTIEFDATNLPLYFVLDKLSDKKNDYEAIYNFLKNFSKSDIKIIKKEIKDAQWRYNFDYAIKWENL
jgi:hypothetical protein